MKINKRNASILAVAVVLAASSLLTLKGCGGGGQDAPGGSGSSNAPSCLGGGISITYPTREDIFTTSGNSVFLGGTVYAGYQSNATWHNSATGSSGDCSLFNYDCFLLCTYEWVANIPLAHGSNFIRVVGGGGDACVTATLLPDTDGIAVDTVNDEILVASRNNSTIAVYARTDNGNATPKRIITGPTTGLSYPRIIAVDTVNNEIFTLNRDSSFAIHAQTASGDAAPIRTLSVAYRASIAHPDGIAVDTLNNEIFVTYRYFDGTTSFIDVFARTASGTAPPLRTIYGWSTGLRFPMSIAVDTINGEILVTNINNSITVYARTASGNAAPIRSISGTSTHLSAPYGIAVDAVNNEIFVTNGDASITVYRRTASGDAVPIRAISGASTGLSTPRDIAVDTTNNEIFITDGNSSILVYPRTTNGNVAPIRTLNNPIIGL